MGSKSGTEASSYIHGMRDERLYTTWCDMKARCLNPKHRRYKHYGGNGILICNNWLSFLPFMDWAMTHGYTSSLTLDRIDVDGGYSPDNCRFITTAHQNRNKRLLSTRNTSGYCGAAVTHSGKFKASVKDWKLGRLIYLGVYVSPIAAAIVRDSYILDNKLGLPLNFTYVDLL